MRSLLPANWVLAGYGVPKVCPRHGEPAVEGVRTSFHSRPPGWAYALLLIGALPYLIAVYATRKTVIAQSWPFCVRCKALRIRLLVIGLLGMASGVALFWGSVTSAQPHGEAAQALRGVLFLLGIVMVIAGPVVATRSGWAVIARARATDDGEWVEVLKTDRRFGEQVATLLAQAGIQPGYGRQAYMSQPYTVQPYGAPAYRPQPYAHNPYRSVP